AGPNQIYSAAADSTIAFDGVAMALSATVVRNCSPAEAGPVAQRAIARNDGFSFWKLPENWREALESTIAQSEDTAEHYLFEQYLSLEERQPPTRMNAYYRIKDLIPPAIRHRLNSAAIRMRSRRKFPQWPCESALVDCWRGWLRASLELQGLT